MTIATREFDPNEPAWRQRAISRGLGSARSRAEQRVQQYLDAAFELIDERHTTDFTIQEVIDRSGQSLRGFYQYFDGKDELVLALIEEVIRESTEDLRRAVECTTDPLERLRVFTIRLFEWCGPGAGGPVRSVHDRSPIAEFTVQLAFRHGERVMAALSPLSRILVELLDDAVDARVISVADVRRTASLLQQTVMNSWMANRLVQSPRWQVTAEDTWQFCLRGIVGDRGSEGGG